MTEVTAAIIRREKKFFICRRPKYKARGGLWEFPGGKVEQGENLEDCLIRECREELNITLKVGSLFMELTHEYEDLTIRLYIFNAELKSGEIQLLEHSESAWITAADIDKYDFCAADAEILEKLKHE